jgi:hypothetical protein
MATPNLTLPRPLWESVETVAKKRQSNANQVVKEALEYYLSSQAPTLPPSPEEERAVAVKNLLEEAMRNRREFSRLVAEGKVHPLPKEIPLEQVRKGLSGIKGSLAAEIIKEREEGY